MWAVVPNDMLVHHGIKGQRWGVRRYQRRDGTLTTAGKKRYGVEGRSYDEYKADRKYFKKHGVNFDYVYDPDTRQMNITGYTNIRTGQKMSNNYATAVITGKYKPSTPLSESGADNKKRPSFSTRHKAKKDAKEYARAKMFYGEGAGTRRKLIKAKVNERSKDSAYKAEFEKHLAKQNMEVHASKAKAERHVKDATNTTAKTVRGLYHLSMNDMAKVSAGAAAIYGIAHFTGADKKAASYAKQKASDLLKNTDFIRKGKDLLKNTDFIRKGKDVTKDWVVVD